MPDSISKVLIAEDEEEAREFLGRAVRCDGYSVELAASGEEGLEILSGDAGPYTAVLMHVPMPRQGGLNAVRRIREKNPALPLFILSRASSPADIVAAMKAGATDFLCKPVSHEDVRRVLSPLRPVLPTDPPAGNGGSAEVFQGDSAAMRKIHSLVASAAASDAPVLIQGETGSGKEVVARQLHGLSARSSQPFLKLNCAAMPAALVESELFGCESGALTGAFRHTPGLFEWAGSGTILLDEIGNMDLKLQTKLLPVLQDKTFRRLGGKELLYADARVIATSREDLETAALEGRFRLDLYYRLNVIDIALPPLRERQDEILPLAAFFLRKFLPAAAPPVLPAEVKAAMRSYGWPGNVRELENAMMKLATLKDAGVIAAELLGEPAPYSILETAAKAQQKAETRAILGVLDATHWNRRRAAKILDIDYRALLYKMKKLSIAHPGPRGCAAGSE